MQFGLNGATPMPADYDNDGKTDLAFYNPANGKWWIWFSNTEPNYMKTKNLHNGNGTYGNYKFEQN